MSRRDSCDEVDDCVRSRASVDFKRQYGGGLRSRPGARISANPEIGASVYTETLLPSFAVEP